MIKIKELVKKLLENVEDNEWQFHYLTENRYCEYCIKDDEVYQGDQKEHHVGCQFIALVDETKRYLKENKKFKSK